MKKILTGIILLGLSACTAQIPVPPTLSQPTPSEAPQGPSDMLLGLPFIKRNYTPTDKIFDAKPYPVELINTKDSELIGIKCTPEIYAGSPEYGYYDEIRESHQKLKDQSIIQLFDSLKPEDEKLSIQTYKKCELENGKILVEYQLANRGGGAGYDSVFAFVQENNVIDKIIIINSDPMPYSGCSKILQISSKTIYVQCSGGDGPGAGVYIHEIDIVSKTQKTIYSCEVAPSGEAPDDFTVTCI